MREAEAADLATTRLGLLLIMVARAHPPRAVCCHLPRGGLGDNVGAGGGGRSGVHGKPASRWRWRHQSSLQ
uniref:Secreted protein n=1 Tax=Oryza nivara TaxID=4536 RepID=A0A0E0IFM3_ORYNI